MKSIDGQSKLERPTPRLLSDEPSSRDELGPHSRIARAIATLIRSESGGKTIQIEGSWGSGKSTIIGLLSQELADDPNFRVITYDAWVHSGDPLRRAFISTAIDQLLRPPSWLKGDGLRTAGDKWQEYKDRLAKRIKISTKRTTPTFTPLGKFVVCSALLLPLSVPIFIELAKKWVKTGFQAYVELQQFALLTTGVVSLLPFLCLIVVSLFPSWLGRSADDAFAALINKTSTEELTSTDEWPDPTSIEFQHVFEQILTEAFCSSPRRLVLVIDNLDRLEMEEAQSVWSLLRSFIDNPEFKSRGWLKQLWVVVPTLPSEDENNSLDSSSSSFLEKVFQVRFALPPPALSNWRQYLKKLLTDSFGIQATSEAETIARIMDLHLVTDSGAARAPMPRELSKLVNELVALALQWPEVPISHLAAYVLDRRRRSFMEELRTSAVPSDAIVNLLEAPDLRRTFAGLFFNIDDVQRAYQLLLEPVTVQALLSGNGEPIAHEFKNSPHYLDVVERVLVTHLPKWASAQSDSFLSSVFALRKGLLSDSGVPPFPPNVLRNLERIAAKHVPSLRVSLGDERTRLALVDLMMICDSDRVISAVAELIRTLSSADSDLLQALMPSDDPTRWLEEFVKLIKIPPIFKKLSTEGPVFLRYSPKEWTTACQILNKDGDALRVLTYRRTTAHMQNGLVKMAEDGEFSVAAVDAVRYEIGTIGPRVSTEVESFAEQLVEALSTYLRRKGIAEATVAPSLEAIIELRNSTDVSASLGPTVEMGHLYHWFSESPDPRNKALAIISILICRSDGWLRQNYGQSEQGAAAFKKLIANPSVLQEVTSATANLLVERRWLDLLVKWIETYPNTLRFCRCLITDNKEVAANVFTYLDTAKPAEAVNNMLRAIGSDDVELREVIVQGHLTKDTVSELLGEDLTNENAWFFALAVKATPTQSVLDAVRSKLKGIAEETWTISLSRDGVGQLAVVIRQFGEVQFGSGLRSALTEHARAALQDSGDPSEISASLATMLEPQHQHGLGEDLYELVVKSSGTSQQFWTQFGAVIELALIRGRHRNNVTRRLVLLKLAQRDWPALQWIAALLQRKPLKDLDDNETAAADAMRMLREVLDAGSSDAENSTTLQKILASIAPHA